MTHQSLQIVRGVPKAVGDTSSGEEGLEPSPIDLLTTPGVAGFSLEPDGWQPARASIKRGGVFVESSVSDGAALMAVADDNVTEKMSLVLSGASRVILNSSIAKLQRFADFAERFHTDFAEMQPVYLKWQAGGASIPQYALIYTIDFDVEDDTPTAESGDAVFLVRLSITREPYWRWLVPPGGNPKLWTAFKKDQTFTTTQMNLSTGTTDTNFAYSAFQNRKEWNATQTAFQSQNWIDIDAVDIPGDAPALVCLAASVGFVDVTQHATSAFYVARRTGRRTFTSRGSYTQRAHNILNAGDALVGTNTSLVNDTGAPISDSTASTGKRSETTFGTATMASRLQWSTNEEQLDQNLLRGQFMCFLRARLSATSTVVNARLRFAIISAGVYLTLPSQTIVFDSSAGGTGNSNWWVSHYMGTAYIGSAAKGAVGVDGLGLDITTVGTSDTNLIITLDAERTSGAGNLYVSDIILMPFDECALYVTPTTGLGMVDNSGYMTHGMSADNGYAARHDANSPYTMQVMSEVSGEFPTLIPGIDNRLYFYATAAESSNITTKISQDITARINIVPRSLGAADI